MFQQDAVMYASRALTDCELKYAPVEPEFLAFVFPATKLDQYVFVHPDVTTHTGHKPLASKCIESASSHDVDRR